MKGDTHSCKWCVILKLIYRIYILPSLGTEEAEDGAASTRMSNRTRKLENILIAETKEIKHIKHMSCLSTF